MCYSAWRQRSGWATVVKRQALPFWSLHSLIYFLVSPQGTYEPGKRHWLKVKKDYLNEGAMADTADLVVLGAFYGQGSKGQWCLVPMVVLYQKIHTGRLASSICWSWIAWSWDLGP